MNYPNRFSTAVLTFVFLIALSITSNAQVQSDYEIYQNFNREYTEILNGLKTAETADEMQDLLDRVEELESTGEEHREMLNRVMYPETVNDHLSSLRELTQASYNHLVRIEQQGESIREFERQVGDLSGQMERNILQSDSLRVELERMTRSRNANASAARQLREQLQERDELILAMVDSLMISYDRLDLASLSRAEREELGLRVDVENVLGHIASVIESNISFIDTNTQLSAADFLRLKTVQVEFENVWTNIGPRLAVIYTPSAQRENRLTEINEGIDRWRQRINQSVWRSIAAAFENRNIEIESFDDDVSFYTALNNYVDSSLSRVEAGGGSEEELQEYERFANVWHNDIKVNWQRFLIDSEILTYENIATIDRKLMNWNIQAQPTSVMMWVWIGILALIILVLIVILVTQRNKTEPVVKRK
jgi:hypothetical protein